jgi:hypothetical protein
LKIIFLASIALLFVITPVYGQLLSDATGLVNRLDIQTDLHSFEIETVSNFDIPDFEFDKDEKKLTLYITSGLENNLGELMIPQNLLGGNLTFYINDKEYFPQIKTNEKISFVTLNFTGSGDNKLDVFGTTYLSGLSENVDEKPTSEFRESTDYSLELIVLAGSLVVAAFVILMMKKRK